MRLVGALDNFSSLKHISIVLDFLEKINCVEELVAIWILASMFYVGLIGVRFLEFGQYRLTFCVIIVGLVDI